jgi:hypothetical protein
MRALAETSPHTSSEQLSTRTSRISDACGRSRDPPRRRPEKLFWPGNFSSEGIYTRLANELPLAGIAKPEVGRDERGLADKAR